MAFGIDLIREDWLAVGFEHGFSIVSIADLDSIHEIGYYRDTDSSMNFTQFALKENRLYAIGHRGSFIDTTRLYMFELDTNSMNQISYLEDLPVDFKLRHFPNPFNGSCRLAFETREYYPSSDFQIYDILGNVVFRKELELRVGINNISWRPENLPSGVYFARLIIGDYTLTAKLVFLQ